jgi:hypothetical protein
MINSGFVLHCARHLAGRIVQETPDPKRQIERLYEHALARPATESEVRLMTEFLDSERKRLASEGRPRDRLALPAGCPAEMDAYAAAALVDACLAVLNASEFLYID